LENIYQLANKFSWLKCKILKDNYPPTLNVFHFKVASITKSLLEIIATALGLGKIKNREWSLIIDSP
jgi:hypothetical protein